MEENKIYYTRVLPLVKYVKTIKNGKEYTECLDNLSSSEIKSLPSTKARMLWDEGDELYLAEQPLFHRGGTGIKFSVVFLYDELTKEEQEKYYDRTILLPLTREFVIQVYGEKSKRVFPIKKRRKKEETK